MSEIVVVGAGAVGVAIATSVLHGGLADRLILSDVVGEKAEGEALDFAHGAPLLGGATVEAVPLGRVRGGDVCIVTAGAKQRAGETRQDLLARNVTALHGIADRLEANGLPRVLLVVTNPVDTMTELLRRRFRGRDVVVLGSGTVLDTMRLRRVLAGRLGVAAGSVHAMVVGEHGDSSVCLLHAARVGGVPLAELLARAGTPLDDALRATLAKDVRGAAYEVIARKGATSHAIGVAAARIVRAIVRDEQAVLPVTVPLDDEVSIGLPAAVGRRGAVALGLPEMSDDERAAWDRSVAAVRESCRRVG